MPRSLRAFLVSLVPCGVLACAPPAAPVPSLVLPAGGSRSPAAAPSAVSAPRGAVVAGDDAFAPTHVPRCIDPVRDPLPIHPASRHRVVRASYAMQKAFLPAMEASDPELPGLALRLGKGEMQLAYLEPGGSYESDAEAHFAIASKGKGEVGLEGKYRLALAFECSGRLPEERALLLAIVQADPRSAFAPYAYFAFGELFRAEAEHDPVKYPLTLQAYEKASEYASSPIAKVAAERLRDCKTAMSGEGLVEAQ